MLDFVLGGAWSLLCFAGGYWLKNGTIERVIERIVTPVQDTPEATVKLDVD